jgi:hypothetical protein
MSVSVITAATTLRVLVGIIGVGYSLYSNRTPTGDFDFSKITEAIFGETVGGLFSDWFREGTSAAHDALFQNLEKASQGALVTELQLTVRRAQLAATLMACQACITRFSVERPSLASRARAVVKRDDEIRWLNAVADHLKQQLKDSFPSIEKMDSAELITFFSEINDPTDEPVQGLKARAKSAVLSDIRNAYYDRLWGQVDIPVNQRAYDALEDAILNGWTPMQPTTGHLTELGIGSVEFSNTTGTHEWFDLVCLIYNSDFQSNQRIQDALLQSKTNDIQTAILNFSSEGLQALGQIRSAIATLTTTVEEVREEVRSQHEQTQMKWDALGELVTQALQAVLKESGLTANALGGLSPSIINAFESPPMEGMVIRSTLVARLITFLANENVLVLYGSTGMGKSILSYQLADDTGVEWQRLDMRGSEPEQIKQRLLYARAALKQIDKRPNLIIDDLNFGPGITHYDKILADFLNYVTSAGSKVIISSQNIFPAEISSVVSAHLESVPALTTAEIEELARLHGCPADQLEKWSNLVWAQTKGHPLLAHMRVLNMQQSGWRITTAEELLQPASLQQAREEVRGILADTLLESERTLVYRLSVFTTRFSREQAITMANHRPALPLGGELFDRLVGPWIEPVDQKFFRLSPLLEGNAEKVFGNDETKRLHRTAAKALLSFASITHVEFGALLMHGILGDYPQPFVSSTLAWAKLSDEERRPIADFVDWFKFIAEDKQILTNDLGNQFARALQFEIAEALNDEKFAKRIVARWDTELQEMMAHASSEKEQLMFTTLECRFLQTVLFSSEIRFDFSLITFWTVRMLTAFRRLEDGFSSGQFEHDEPPEILSSFYQPAFVLGNVLTRCQTADDVLDFVRALDNPDNADAERLWNVLRAEESSVAMLVDKVWLDEVKKPTPNWQACLERIDVLIDTAHRWKADGLLANLYVAKSLIHQEYLDSHDTAITLLDEATERLGYEHVEVTNYRAKIFLLEGEYAEALRLWSEYLPKLSETKHYGRLFFCHDAQVAAGKLEKWDEVLKFALKGVQMASHTPWDVPNVQVEESVYKYCFKADSAIAYWYLERKARALDELAEVISWLQRSPVETLQKDERLLFFKLHPLLSWMHLSETDSRFSQPPVGGAFSDPNRFETETQCLTVIPYTFLWYLMAEVEHKVSDEAIYWERLQVELQKSPNPPHEMVSALLGLRRDISSGVLDHIVNNYTSTLKRYAASDTRESKASAVKSLLLFVILKRLAEGQSVDDLPFEVWISEIRENGFDDILPWLEILQSSVRADTKLLASVMADITKSDDERIIAAGILAFSPALVPRERLYADVLMLNSLKVPPWDDTLDAAIERTYVQNWRSIAYYQRFALLRPISTAPAILEAVDDKTRRGRAKAANIVLVARAAVDLPFDSEVVSSLQSLSANVSQ